MARGKAIEQRWGDLNDPKPLKDCDADPDEIKSRIVSGLKGLTE